MLVYKVLHITPHLGGGVGSTLLGYFSFKPSFSYVELKHEVVAFGYTLDFVKKRIDSLKIPYTDHITYEEVIKKIKDFDVVVIHAWNHPLLYDFLVRNELPPCRLIMLAHNSGFHPPNIYTRKMLTYPDLFVCTTPLGYKTEDVQGLSKEEKRFFKYVIWSTGGMRDVTPKKHEGFNIGYIGTVDYAKLHPDFLSICSQIDIPNVKFIVVGGPKEKELEKETKRLGIHKKFVFTGYSSNLEKYLEIFDVFGYPLNPKHYGTCDLTLQEAMGAGVVPIVLYNNPMEERMVKDMETGMIAHTQKGYIRIIETLYKHPELRNKLAKNAKEYAHREFSLKKLYSQWKIVLEQSLEFPKTTKRWDIKKCLWYWNKAKITYKDVFLESLGHYGKAFVENNIEEIKKLAKLHSWQSETKGTVHNYHSYFPDDPYLKKWSKLMKKNA